MIGNKIERIKDRRRGREKKRRRAEEREGIKGDGRENETGIYSEGVLPLVIL